MQVHEAMSPAVVTVDGVPSGIVTMTDLVHQHREFLSAACSLDAERRFVSDR